MSRLQSYINEIFDTNVEIDILKSSSKQHIYAFEIGYEEYQYKFDATKQLDDKWEILFGMGDSSYLEMGITGTGSTVQVFAAVAKCMDIFLKKVKPKKFVFSAKEDSRKKLYLRMSKILTRKYPYTFTTGGESGSDQEFIFTRK